MKNIFEVIQEEKNRILGMHESATKEQYLQTISEQTYEIPSYTTKQWNNLYMAAKADAWRALGSNTKFEATKDSKIVTAKEAKVYSKPSGVGAEWDKQPQIKRVSFYCQQGKFYVQGEEKTPYISDGLSKALVSNLCGKLNYQTKVASSGAKFKQAKDSSFVTENGLVRMGPKAGTTWSWDGKQATAPGIDGGTVIFKCRPSKFGFNFEFNGAIFKDRGFLKDALVKRFCKVADNTSSSTTQPTTPTVTPTPAKTQVPLGVNVSDLNKQIQQSLGNQQPTGQITDTEIDAILTKLG